MILDNFNKHLTRCPNCGYLNKKYSKYKKAYDILMEYWDSLPDEEKTIIHNKLSKLNL